MSEARPAHKDDPEATRRVIEGLFPDPVVRRRLLERFLATITEAHRINPGSWETTLHVDGSRPYVRLNVGAVLGFDLTGNAVNLLVSDAFLPEGPGAATSGANATHGRFKAVTGTGWLTVPLTRLEMEWPRLQADHLEAVRRAAGARRLTNFFPFHCPGVLDYLELELGRPVPRPDYGAAQSSSVSQDIIRLIRRRYEGWTGFADPAFVKDEIDYKRAAAAKASELLAEADLRKYLDVNQGDEIVQRLEKVAHATNLLFLGVPKSGDLSILYQPHVDSVQIARAVVDLLYGDGDTPERLDRFAAWARGTSLPCKWPFATYFLFLCNPATEIFVKPERTRRFLSLLRSDVELPGEVSGATYAAVRDLATRLLAEMEDQGAQDMIDIQSAIFVAAAEGRPTRYWKIAPGDGAWEWPQCLQQGYIAIGCEALGDVGSMTRAQYEARRAELEKAHEGGGGWGRRGMDQVWRFSRIEEGDRIVANNGTTEVLGIGTVIGAYSFTPGIRHGHHLPVRWDDLTPRAVQFPGWLKTLDQLNAEQFASILAAPPVPPDKRRKIREKSVFSDPVGIPAPPQASTGPTAGATGGSGVFSPRAFELLGMLSSEPKAEVYFQHKDEFVTEVEEPVKQLMRGVAERLRPEVLDRMETSQRLFAKIVKNDWGRGGAWDYFWGAFYPKGSKRIADAQLFVILHPGHFDAGFYIGDYAGNKAERFAANLRRNRALIGDALKESSLSGRLLFGKKELHTDTPRLTLEAWLDAAAELGPRVALSYEKTELLRADPAAFVSEIATLFDDLFPLVLLAAEDDPAPQLRAYLGDVSPETEEAPAYTLDDLAADTFMAKEDLESWVRAVERKKQAIIYGPPGTGKTFVATKLANHLIAGGDGFVDTLQFHPAYAYEDFVQGIRPVSDGDGATRFELVPGRFLEFCREAALRKGICVLIVDEINRANLSRVFGELMYLLEYRNEQVPLAAGGQLRIPRNVRIIGTMNTADRSIALVDHALRRRFAFLPLWPNYDVLREFHRHANGYDPEPLIGVLRDLNHAINDVHYQVGVSFFLRKDVEEHLAEIWRQEIEPYLEEYFFNHQDAVAQFRWDRVRERLGGE